MIDMQDPDARKKAFIIAGACLICLIAGMIYGCHKERNATQPTVMPYQDTTDPVKAADKLKLSDDSAKAVTKEIYRIQQTQPTPQVTYYVQAPDLTSGAEVVAKEIKEDKPSVPAAAREKTDRTVVTADHDHQKVDVYKVSLRKPHKIKAGLMTADGKTYGGIGYQAGRWEGMVYTRNGRKVDAAAITYTLAEW
ncbi:MAG: hypothetical protein LKE88_00795 [Acidaminococcus provencensis]|jgi:hypothetical protein|uniref:hypothetical protein n=1 Tax=Acidaminococcus provencensis TaxID=2058289 RepID=UPI0023F1AA54|nr:hypothetical protein [Acidaminococcus provencensis]MCH4095178.1 hypothetical protein [Acidaminococcus provencensis]